MFDTPISPDQWLVNQQRQINDYAIYPNIWQLWGKKNLPFPERFNYNFNSPLWSIISSIKNIKKIFGHYRILVQDAF